MHTLYLNKRKYEIPSKWEELSGEQLVEIAGILHMQVSKMEALARIFLVLMNMRRQDLWTRWVWAFGLSEATRYDCREFAFWVLETENECTLNKVPVVKLRGSYGYPLFGPLRECRGFVFIEFIEADTAYLGFRKNFEDPDKRKESLDKLFAILYRDKNKDMPDKSTPYPRQRGKSSGRIQNWSGDPREAYNPNILEYRIQALHRVPIKYKYAALLFYHACHMNWEKNHPNIFKKAKAKSEGDGGGGDWGGALMSLAGGSINIDKMMKANAAAALRDLDNRIEEQERLEAEMEAKKRKKTSP